MSSTTDVQMHFDNGVNGSTNNQSQISSGYISQSLTNMLTDEKYLLFVSGYSRESSQMLSARVPSDVISIIFSFAKKYFRWKGNASFGSCLQFFDQDDCKVAKEYEDREWNIIALTNYVISSQDFERFEWEIQIHSDHFLITLGFMDPNLCDVDDLCDYFDLMGPLDKSLGRSQVYIASGANACTHYGNLPYDCEDGPIQKGDTFRFNFDFIKEECILFHNGLKVATYKDIPSTVIGAMGFWYDGVVTCNKFKGISKEDNDDIVDID